jgi:initiation factor 1A
MVKNLSGGNKSKGFARKNTLKKDNALITSTDDLEVYAQVTKILGGAMCQVVCLDGTEMICHIRGKFRGRHKRDNMIQNGTWLLVGKREWEKEPAPGKLMNCDVMEVYSEQDKQKLKNNLATINWMPFVANDTKVMNASTSSAATAHPEDNIVFTDEKTEEYQALMEIQLQNRVITMVEEEEWINIEDI